MSTHNFLDSTCTAASANSKSIFHGSVPVCWMVSGLGSAMPKCWNSEKNKHTAQTIGLNMLMNYRNLWSHLSILNMLIGENGLYMCRVYMYRYMYVYRYVGENSLQCQLSLRNFSSWSSSTYYMLHVASNGSRDCLVCRLGHVHVSCNVTSRQF